ncbi:MAG: TIR domain-containing protein [Symploca sp. SIO3E6]|nr:TIR domain-containing protein [Caldora sp. SIO3E6]
MQLFDAFISYGRPDSKAFATKLQACLADQGFRIWFDFNDIPKGVDFQHQIDDGIEKAHHFLFVIAPHSVNSEYCLKEIELAIKCHKRIIPLLHVEQISQETWQQRYPHQTIEDWEAYKAEGKHSHFPNMHPTIRKINWVYFREGIDDFDKSLGDLIKLLSSHTDYVQKHTQLLVKALEWERQQKQTRYLLTGEERQQATSWLKKRFKKEQPPCTPSDLHCEYITESIKNSNNLMTQVFLSYATQDRAVMEKIGNSLRRESITVWTNKTDIQTGEVSREAINRGIEQADNVVYLLSPESINSIDCQQELDLAVSLNKRIIPVLVKETEPSARPEVLRQLQHIDLTDNVKEDDYRLDESQLLKILQEDEAYYNEHKMLLTKALKWEDHENPSLLLRGYNLRSAESWLKIAQKRKQHPPTQLQEEFIAESLGQPPLESLDVFIAYSRADSDLARKLNDSLQMQGKTTWFDQETIASDTDVQQEIHQGITVCNNFLFILSPHSVNSEDCQQQVKYAASLNKRFVTVVYQPANQRDLPTELAKVPQIDFNQKDFNANFNELVRTLDIDKEHVRSHTKWSRRALEWQEKDKNDDLLLRESEFAIAQDWLQGAEVEKKTPIPTPLQQEYIRQSQEAIEAEITREKRRVVRLKCMVGVMTALFFAALGMSWFARQQQRKAEENLAAQVDALSRYSKTLVISKQNIDALIEGIRAGKQLIGKSNAKSNQEKKTSQQVKTALREALYDSRESQRLGGQGTSVVKFSPDNQTIATIDKDRQAKLWNFNNQDNTSKPLSKEQEVTDIVFSPGDGKIIATLSKDKAVQLWNKDGDKLASLPQEENVSEVELSPDGKLVATFSNEKDDWIGKLWKLEKGELQPLIPSEQFNYTSFSTDGKIATYNPENNTTKFWQFDENELKKFNFLSDKERNNFFRFYPETKIIINIDWAEETVKFWSLEGKEIKFSISAKELGQDSLGGEISSDGKMLATWENNKDQAVTLRYSDGRGPKTLSHDAEIAGVWFSPDNEIIVTASKDTMVKLWNQEGKEIATLPSHSKPVYKVTFSQDSKVIATTSYDKTVKLWNDKGNKLKTLYPNIAVNEVHFNSDHQTVATLDENNIVKLWNVDNSDRKFLNHEVLVDSVSFSPNKQLMVTYSSSGENSNAKLWNLEGEQRELLTSEEKLDQVEFSPNSKLIITSNSSGDNSRAQLWSIEDKKIQSLLPEEEFETVEFSPDGKLMVTSSLSGDNPRAQLWSIEDKKIRSLLPQEKFDQVEFNPDGRLVALFSNNEDQTTIKLWNPDQDKNPIRFITLANEPEIKFSPDGKFMAISDSFENKQTGKLWSVEGEQRKLVIPEEKFDQVEFSPDGRLMALFSNNEDKTTIKILSLEGEQPQFLSDTEQSDKVEFSTENFNQVEFSPDGQLIAIFSDNEQKTGIELLKREGMALRHFNTDDLAHEHFNEVEFSPNGELIVTSTSTLSWDNPWEKHKLWSVDSSAPQEPKLQPIHRQFYEVVFSPNSKLIATFDGSNTVRLWNQKNEVLASLDFKDSINKLSFSPDNQKLAITSDSKTVVLWDFEQRTEWKELPDKGLKELVEEGCDKVKNYLKRKQNNDKDLCEDYLKE